MRELITVSIVGCCGGTGLADGADDGGVVVGAVGGEGFWQGPRGGP